MSSASRLSAMVLCAASPRRRSEPSRHHERGPRLGSEATERREPGTRLGSARSRRLTKLVLIIDDSVHTREMYAEYLKFRGLAVVTAPEAEAGLALAHSLKPDVIVMDIAMPGLNGITATRWLKRDLRTRRIPVIVLTGYAFRAIENGALEAGADAFLTKPCLPEDLETRILQLLGGSDRAG